LNEFEFQKNQDALADEKETPFAGPPHSDQSQAEHIAEVTAEAHRKVERRQKKAVAKANTQ
jgi:hypothetical protein